ncbi:zinc-binding alcohol dehydrogenase family protein [Paraburkholderia hospita]|jgi:propanol-preferring alcohol dehydrogenase|uniref:Zinc-binding alcohol dehydrogenase family protein n=1 Tax=Paraburkholderia hospita TaxID=169430 RepID=A0ABP2PEV3_9BURK|nr:zinc-binding alcohol dehydrogenase family protein [Paraburkholderia hospita]SEI28185.1 alcohol dehydrogenase, propanol-preferring [Paraburkholderia hospita]
MKIAGEMQLDIGVTRYPLAEANRALDDLRSGRPSGAAVLMVR